MNLFYAKGVKSQRTFSPKVLLENVLSSKEMFGVNLIKLIVT